MELKITKEEYKSHPFPTKLLILFIIFSIVGIVCVEIVAINQGALGISLKVKELLSNFKFIKGL